MKAYYRYDFGSYSVLQTPTLWDTYQNYNYMITHKNRAVIFDPGEASPIEKTLHDHNMSVEAIVLTHHHGDHVGGVKDLRLRHACPVYGYKEDQHRLPELTETFVDQDTLQLLGLEAQVMHLPGHTLGLCAFYFEETRWLFSNDLIFSMGCGRVFEGNYAQMYKSLEQTAQLPGNTLVWASHEYTKSNLDFALSVLPKDTKLLSAQSIVQKKQDQGQPTVPTTLDFERTYNPFLRCDDKQMCQQLGLKNQSPEEVFAYLRSQKDQA